MKTIFSLSLLLATTIALAEAKTDPNMKKTSTGSTVVAPGCTEFVHPCSGQSSAALLNAMTLPQVNKLAAPLPASTKKAGKTK